MHVLEATIKILGECMNGSDDDYHSVSNTVKLAYSDQKKNGLIKKLPLWEGEGVY